MVTKIKPSDRFPILRGDMKTLGLENADIAQMIGKTPQHVSRCLNAKADFLLSEQYIILRGIYRKPEDMYLVFPENGILKDRTSAKLKIAGGCNG